MGKHPSKIDTQRNNRRISDPHNSFTKVYSKIEAQNICDVAQDEGINPKIINKFFHPESSSVNATKNLIKLCISDMQLNPLDVMGQKAQQNCQQVVSRSQQIRKKYKKIPYERIKIEFRQFIITKKTSIDRQYRIQQKIGHGGYGIVFKGQMVSKAGQFRAIKRLQKSVMGKQVHESMVNQFQMLMSCDHPNIIKIYQIYQDSLYYYVVTQLCTGGSLLSYLNAHRRISQDLLKIIMNQILSSVNYLHSFKILHRDLKLQNILIVEAQQDPNLFQIKIIDFGLSLRLQDQYYKKEGDQIEGTLLYMSPQSLYGEMAFSNDIWSCGIILYMLSTKKLPYQYRNDQELILRIEKGRVTRKHLHPLNLQIKLLINSMLEKDHSLRFTAQKLIQNQWLNSSKKSISNSQKRRAATQLLTYNTKNNFESMIESYLCFQKINQKQRQKLVGLFAEIDKDKSGHIDIAQLKQFCKENAQDYCEQEVEKLLNTIDKNKSGYIDFTEFITAMYNKRELFQAQNLKEAFQFFDKDQSGNITRRQIRKVLLGVNKQQVDMLFKQMDEDSDEQISKSEFFKYFHTVQY